ncbi:hypothetical protein M899_0846 [Bacteriovorax sp. BSW11_IV]|uniref:hypothetical protein n=1 Tax=Bacteriovorax sp. BSW11_IV TaxID=1353529 RepID=UPI00038A1EF1|nr:hypothetical protein [Bacteriovorax sp. BSW11_IV]EQC42947.1 hypothetical protein M899_0846 [Bacteriovorax sp. BSW11_IV]
MRSMLSIAVIGLLTSGNIHAEGLAKRARGNSFNPQIGLNSLFSYKNSNKNSSTDGFSFDEAELQFSSDVDAYFRAEATIAIHKEIEEEEHDGHTHNHTSYAVEPEEIFVETTALPVLTVRAGKFLTSFGKLNTTHTHALPFVDKGLLQEKVFGDEGLSEVGASVSGLLPLSWFSELTYSALQGDNEDVFNAEDKHSLGHAARFTNLFELSDSATIEFGLSGLTQKAHEETKTDIYGADLTFKWKPVNLGKYNSFSWSTEYIKKDKKGEDSSSEVKGVSSYLKYQTSQRTFVQYRFEDLKVDDVKNTAHSALVAYVPSEFSSIRLQFDRIDDNSEEKENKLTLQFNISIGAHPAHNY